MGQIIQLRRSTIPGTRPINLEDGELSVNVYDGKLFIKKDAGAQEFIEEVFVTDTWVTGSLQFKQEVADIDILRIRNINNDAVFTITTESIVQIQQQQSTPTPIPAGFMYSASNFWLGIE